MYVLTVGLRAIAGIGGLYGPGGGLLGIEIGGIGIGSKGLSDGGTTSGVTSSPGLKGPI